MNLLLIIYVTKDTTEKVKYETQDCIHEESMMQN
jgi:hypothetical protein